MWQQSEHRKIAESYELKKTLGRGHFAVVKLAHHVFSGEKVAVKVIDKTKMDKISADHLYHEVTCMKLVQHPNVVRLYQVIETSSKLYLILELGDGGDMFDYIMRHDKGLHEDLAKEYFSQIVSAIAYCHKLHVVHRDLKPENVVFFESQGLVKLTDFGFSNRYRPGEKLSTSCGSLAYSAPEILLGEEYDAPAVDVWSLGVILYMLVCGVAPFNEANDSETLINIMDCRYTVLDHVSDECQDLIKRMIIREPSQRITLDDIGNHSWLAGAKSYKKARRNSIPIFTRNNIPPDIHRSILDTMIKAQIADEKEILQALSEDRYDHITSTYILLAERELVQQSNPEDVSSDNDSDDGSEMTLKRVSSEPTQIGNRLRPMYPDAQNLSTGSSLLSASPPCNQATLLPSTSTVAPLSLDPARRRTRSSSSEDSNSSLSTSIERRSNPSYIREHLTITPRHGFSVAHGGINTLIEEEERSRSQTTTDDECDTADDITNMVNPKHLANQLQRTLQLKRFKKRKSAPVLNEICEEAELENDNGGAEMGDGPPKHLHHVTRHSISTSSPSSHVGNATHKPHTTQGFPKDQAHFASRPGRTPRRRKSHKSSSSEASEDDTESRRTSSTNLSHMASHIMFTRRSYDDDDDDATGGPSGRPQAGTDATPQATFTEDQATATASTRSEEGNGDNLSGEAQGTHQHDEEPKLNNATSLPLTQRKPLQREVTGKKIVNVFGVRSRSAESHTSSSSYSVIVSSRSSSSARSSCSSLCSSNRLHTSKKTTSWFRGLKNSSSTRSDTGLVLRYHKNNILVKCQKNNLSSQVSRSSSSSSFTGINADMLRNSSSLTCVSPPKVDGAAESDGALAGSRHNRSCSLPRHHRKKRRSKNSQRNVDCGGFTNKFLHGSNDELCESVAQESLTVKKSNLSLASSTCSGSKYVVDPVNELPPSPCLTPLPEFLSKKHSIREDSFDFEIMLPGKEDKAQSPTQEPLNNFRPMSKDADGEDSSDPKYQQILTRLNNIKSRRYSTLSDGTTIGSCQLKVEHRIVRKVKARDCCYIM